MDKAKLLEYCCAVKSNERRPYSTYKPHKPVRKRTQENTRTTTNRKANKKEATIQKNHRRKRKNPKKPKPEKALSSITETVTSEDWHGKKEA